MSDALTHLILADAAPSGSVLGVAAVVFLALVVGMLVTVFFAVRAVIRLVRRRNDPLYHGD